MRAVQVKEFVAGPQDLQVSDVAEPQPQADEYLVEIRACGANFFDLLQIRGKYQWVGQPLHLCHLRLISGSSCT